MSVYLVQKMAMVANLDHQLHCIWNQLNFKLLGTPREDFLDQILRGRKIHPFCVWHLRVTAQVEGHGRRKLYSLPVYLHRSVYMENPDNTKLFSPQFYFSILSSLFYNVL